MTFDDNDLDALLRQPTERLAPPDGSWELVSRRAQRRKWAKASASVAAGVVIVAGAVPAVIAVRHSDHSGGGNQSIALANPTSHRAQSPFSTKKASPAPPSATTPAVSLAGFRPQSSTFISPTEGFLIGPASDGAVVAKTLDGGRNWSPLASLPVNGNNVGIRFAHGPNGYVFGQVYDVTGDGGLSWQTYTPPGYIRDLETMNDQIWATVSRCALCKSVRLWHGTVADPTLHPVADVGTLPGNEATLVLSTDAVYLMVHDGATQQGQLWWSRNGTTWVKRTDPCDGRVAATFAAWSINGLAAVCGDRTGGAASAVFESATHGNHWNLTGHVAVSDPAAIAAGSQTALIVSQGGDNGAPYVSTDGGVHFTATPTGTTSMGFVGFIDPMHVVALSSAFGTDHAFLFSYNAGLTWTTYPFTK
jgi:hypothetical protein